MNTHAQNKRELGRERAVHALLYAYYQRHGHKALRFSKEKSAPESKQRAS